MRWSWLWVVIGCAGKPDTAPPPTSSSTTPPTDTGPTEESEAPLPEASGCDGAVRYAPPEDPAEPGPYAVGVRTVDVGGLVVDVWYPAAPGASAEPVRYDIRDALSEKDRALIPEDDAPYQECDCARDLPVDAATGPFPAIVFVHGTASFRNQSLTTVTHWASRGFVVLAADHPGLNLADTLALLCPGDPSGTTDLQGDLEVLTAAIAAPSGDLAFLDGAVDGGRLALAGHSAGGAAVAIGASLPNVRVSIPMASGNAIASDASLEGALFLGGLADGIVPWSSTVAGYEASAGPKHLVGLANAGHLAFSDLCAITNDDGDDVLSIALEYEICGSDFAGLLFDCDPTQLAVDVGHAIVEASSTVVLESALYCTGAADGLGDVLSAYPDVDTYQSSGA